MSWWFASALKEKQEKREARDKKEEEEGRD